MITLSSFWLRPRPLGLAGVGEGKQKKEEEEEEEEVVVDEERLVDARVLVEVEDEERLVDARVLVGNVEEKWRRVIPESASL